MKFLPPLFRWVLLAACLCLAAALAASAAQIVQAHVSESIPLSSSIRPETLTAGLYHACAIQTDGAVVCWGNNLYGRATPPSGTFTQVAAGTYHTCGLKSDGEVACWGEELYYEQIPAGPFKQISAGHDYTCGIENYGTVECWGLVPGAFGDDSYQGYKLIQIDTGRSHACGVKEDGTVVCWGYNVDGQATPPTGTFAQVAAGTNYTCGLKTDGAVVCWGGMTDDPEGKFTSISASHTDTCGITNSGTVTCWINPLTPPAGTYTQVAAGMNFACGEKTDGTLACWSGDPENEVVLNSPDILIGPPQISAGSAHACTLNNNGSLSCWGLNSESQTEPPAGAIFQQVSAGGAHTCGIKDDGTLACWGYNGFSQADPPAGAFSQVSAGYYHSCGLKTDGTVDCWGDNSFEQSIDPPGVYTQVSAGGNFGCAINAEDDNKLFCWGRLESYQVTPGSILLEEPLVQISAGGEHICGLTYDSAVRCGGNNDYGQAPDGMGLSNIQVSAGNYHTCALRANGTLHCRGKNDSGQASPPPGTFVEVSAGYDYTCAVSSGGLQICWGANQDGQIPLTLTTDSLPDGVVDSEYDQALAADGGTGPYTYLLTSGSLPDGLTLSEGGEIAGAPTASGTFTFGVLVVDQENFAYYRSYTITVLQPAFNKSGPLTGATDQLLNLTLDWEDSSGASDYEYCYDTSNDNDCSGWKSTGTTSQASIDGLAYSTTYYWQVRAVHSEGSVYANGSPSAYWSFTTTVLQPAFNKSGPLTGATDQLLNLTLDWEDSSGASDYEYCYDTSNDNDCSGWKSTGTTSQASIDGLSYSTTYYWQVRAVHNEGSVYANGSPSAYWSFTTEAAPVLIREVFIPLVTK